MGENQKRLLFLCAHRSVRVVMAASLLAVHEQKLWDIWIAPAFFEDEHLERVRQVLDEVQVPLLSFPQTAEPLLAVPGMKELSYAVVQLTSDISFPTPVGVNCGQSKMFQEKMCQKKSRCSSIAAFELP